MAGIGKPYWAPPNREECLEDVESAHLAVLAAQANLDAAVARARSKKASWPSIARAIGISVDGVKYRYVRKRNG